MLVGFNETFSYCFFFENVQQKIICLVSIIKDCDVTKTSDANQGAKLKKRRARHLMDGRTRTRASVLTMAVFGHLAKNYLRQFSILEANRYKIRKNKDTIVTSIFKIDTTLALIFLVFLLLVPKVEICLR